MLAPALRSALGSLPVAAAAGALLVAACNTRGSAPEVRTIAVAPDAALLTGRAVARPPGGKNRVTFRAVTVGGVARRYRLVSPASPDPARTYPLVLYFHGDGGDGAQMQTQVPFEAASGDTALVAYPDGIDRTWDLETREGNKDVAFAEALVDDVARDFTVDRAQVFATGYSSGGFFANVLACHRSKLLRAIASNAGGAPYHQASTWPNGFPKCPGQGPVAAMALHGDADFGVTLDSGRFTAEYWAYIDGCKANELETTAYPECQAYRGCNAGKDVVFCKVPGLSHWVWDRAATVTYEFFRREGMTP